ncbi:MAG: glycosyltransferase family 4 protein [Microcystaceae cyanobacterium]
MTDHIFVFLEIFAQEGGIQAYIKDVFRAYQSLQHKRNLNAQVLLLRDEAGCDNPFASETFQFTYLKTLSPWKGRLNLGLSLLNSLIRYRPQQVFCGHINLAPLVALLCQPLGIPYTVLTYGKEVWKPLPLLKQKALRQANQIWTISRYSRDRLCQSNQISPEKVKILPCVVDENRFTIGQKSPELKEKYGLGDNKVLMTVARLWSGDIYKGVDVTIRALPKILQAFPDVKYLVIGRGDDKPRLEGLTKELAIEERVIFAGFVPTDQLIDYYHLADVYIMPSQEGFGIVYLEAMCCGIPVLSGDDDGSADPLQDGLMGWRVPHRDPDLVAQGCIQILQGQDQRCDPNWLREKTLAQFSQARLSDRLAELLNIIPPN